MAAYAKQGHGDALCGIYALLNGICVLEGIEPDNVRHREIFSHLIMGADRLGYLDHYHLTVGFEAFELIEIINWISARFDYAVSVSCHRFSLGSSKVVKEAIAGGAIAIQYDSKVDHWVAVGAGPDPIIDSWPTENLISQKRAGKLTHGFILESDRAGLNNA